MKYLLITLLTFSIQYASSQINGNGKIKTVELTTDNIHQILINVNVEVVINTEKGSSRIEITTDENIIPYINTEVSDGILDLNQKKWIESSGLFKIKINAPELKAVYNDSWADVRINLKEMESFKLVSNISDINIEGEVADLYVETKDSDINLTGLIFNELVVDRRGDGSVIVSPEKGNNRPEGTVTENEFKNLKNEPIFANARFIEIHLRNNCNESFSAYVKGPKQDGAYFSYGFNIHKNQVKKERWSIGTKLYKVNDMGQKTEIYTVRAEDEGKTVNIWK